MSQNENRPPFIHSTSSKSPKWPSDNNNSKKLLRYFEAPVVGLGIVAAMNENGDTHDVKAPVSPKSDPIPIVSGVKWRRPVSEMEVSESYTCVIAHIGGETIRKVEYFEDECEEDGIGCNLWESSGIFLVSPPGSEMGFLDFCYLCRKKLKGLDIFMYRGEKAFCSVECRCQQMSNDEEKEKFRSEALKPFHCSVSPCSAPRLFSAGVLAA